jgi:acyl dehydratase
MLNWKVGDELEEVELEPITRLDLIKYAGASGDYNPIHTVDESAREEGLPGIIAHGMFTAATMGNLFSPYLERGYVGSLGARFVGMVRLGDILRVGGVVTSVTSAPEPSGPDSEPRVYGFEVYARTGSETVVTGTAEFVYYGSH